MASSVSQKLEEKLVCSICLELFRVAVTLPCGHNFCQQCISDHWEKQEQEASRAEKGYTCPECRKRFQRRLELKKNVTLCSVVELVRVGEAQIAGAEGREAAHGGQCPRHGRPLELYCEDERRCICCVCTVQQCQHHRRVLFEEERSKKQALLRESLEKAQQESERIEQAMQELENQTNSIKDSSERLKSMVVNKFGHLEKALEDCQRQTVARIEQEQAAALGQVEENWSHLKECLDALSHHREKAQDLLACADDQTFLEEFPLLASPESPEALPPVEFNVGMVEPIAEILTDISKLLLEDLPSSVAPKAADPVAPGPVQPEEPAVVKAVAPLPKCQLRAELLKDHRNLTFDAETANKYLQLSSRNQKAKHPRGTGSPQQDHAARFELWQVLCAQSYGHGHHYWEVKVSSHSVIVGVTYQGIPRKRQPGHKFNIGLDGGSWGLQVREDCYLAWHKGRSEKIQERLYEYLGVSLDYGNGILSFYGLGDRTQLIHTFHHIFTEPLYPVFWLCEGRTVTLCQRD
ncbi:E3 ubiquitin-protein ligase TRIM65 isoform X1 [Apteryx mantelli]|uniref:RING-type E3 ubiquitin transferase n=1 Tax=Apteryx mantelli TaxID=2696672 RepID=A0ABM4FH47_9AVES